MVKKILLYIMATLIVVLNITFVYGEPSILSESAILMDATTGTVIFEKNSQARMYPASLTKIMTAILAIEKGDLTDIITVDEETPFETVGSKAALEPNEILTLKDLLYALMLPSANDAATVIAKHYGNTTNEFVQMMNDKSKELGAVNTNFVNPHGLHDVNHYSTAEDLAIITKYAMQNETFRTIVGTIKYEILPTNKKSESRPYATLNRLLHSPVAGQINVDGIWISPVYDGTKGVKTGYTPEAGNCLSAYAQRNSTSLIAVTLKGVSLDMYTDTHNLFNYGFNEYENINLVAKNTFIQNLDIANGDSKQISLITNEDLNVFTKKNNTGKIDFTVVLNEIILPIEKDTILGSVEFSLDGKNVGTVNLVSPISVQSVNNNNSFSIPLPIKIVLVLTLFIVSIRLYNKIRVKIIRDKRKKRRAGSQNNT